MRPRSRVLSNPQKLQTLVGPVPVAQSRWPSPGGPVPWPVPVACSGGPVPVPVPVSVSVARSRWPGPGGPVPVARSRSRSRWPGPGLGGPVPVARSRWPDPGGLIPVARSRWPGPGPALRARARGPAQKKTYSAKSGIWVAVKELKLSYYNKGTPINCFVPMLWKLNLSSLTATQILCQHWRR